MIAVVFFLTVLDSSAHLNDGILNGNVIFLGNYDSCLEVDFASYEENGKTVEGFRSSFLQCKRPSSYTAICSLLIGFKKEFWEGWAWAGPFT